MRWSILCVWLIGILQHTDLPSGGDGNDTASVPTQLNCCDQSETFASKFQRKWIADICNDLVRQGVGWMNSSRYFRDSRYDVEQVSCVTHELPSWRPTPANE